MSSSWMNSFVMDSAFLSLSRYFPRGALDGDGQQLDLRRKNSWGLELEDVPLTELVGILVVNVISPFLLCKELKGLLRTREPKQRAFIVNDRPWRGSFTGVYMTAVDTGWVTDERPLPQARHESRNRGFRLPLDSIAGAARIVDPIVQGITDSSTQPFFAVFLKDFCVSVVTSIVN